MRHRKRGRKLGRDAAHRKALERNLISALFTHGRISTTLHKAKEYRPHAEKLITLARKGIRFREQGQPERYVHCMRLAVSRLQSKPAVRTLFTEIAPAYADRPGGYTRIVRYARNRLGDNAPRAIWELIPVGSAAPEPKAKGKGKSRKK
jgi:large subunit ribosomal protein L17